MRVIFFILAAVTTFSCKEKKSKQEIPAFNDELVQRIRAAANSIPGPLPLHINYLKYAATIRKWKDLVEDGGNDAATMARTVFQVEYSGGTVMIDAGMDRQVHHFFEKDGPQPFDTSAASLVVQAIQQAKLILITHEHGDHVANVVRLSDNSIPLKTVLTRAQADALLNDPQMPEIKLDENKSTRFIITDFTSILPVAPGIVLIKAPGHTPGEIMIYTKLENGREFIFAGDVSWTYKGVEEKKMKPESESKRLGENRDDIKKELSWLNERLTKDKMQILVSHDDIMLPQLAAQGVIGNKLVVTK